MFIVCFLSASSLVFGFLAFEAPLLGLLRKGDYLSGVWCLIAMPLMVPAVYNGRVTVQIYKCTHSYTVDNGVIFLLIVFIKSVRYINH